MWEPRRLTTLWAFMACYKDSFTLPFTYMLNLVRWEIRNVRIHCWKIPVESAHEFIKAWCLPLWKERIRKRRLNKSKDACFSLPHKVYCYIYTAVNLSYAEIYHTDIRHLKSNNKHVRVRSKQNDVLTSKNRNIFSAPNPYRWKSIRCSASRQTARSRKEKQEQVCGKANRLKKKTCTQDL
jgi:hypothetical protein